MLTREEEKLQLLKQQMNLYNLLDWDAKLNNQIGSAGICYINKKIIYLSKKYIKYANDKQIMNTMLHEIAHALEWVRYKTSGHGEKWKSICREIGCDYTVKENRQSLFKGQYDKYTYTCNECGYSFGSVGKRTSYKKWICGKCKNEIFVEQLGSAHPTYKKGQIQNNIKQKRKIKGRDRKMIEKQIINIIENKENPTVNNIKDEIDLCQHTTKKILTEMEKNQLVKSKRIGRMLVFSLI